MKRINGFLKKTTECRHYSESLTGRNGTPYSSGELLKATLSPTEQVIVRHFSSGPLNTLLAFWIASATKKNQVCHLARQKKMCVRIRLICLRRFCLTSPHIPVPSHREKHLAESFSMFQLSSSGISPSDLLN